MFCGMSAQNALTYHKNYKNNNLFNLAGWEDEIGYDFSLKSYLGINFSVMTSFIKKDFVGDEVKNSANYFTHDDFPDNFPNFRPISNPPSKSHDNIYSSFKKDYGFSIQLYYSYNFIKNFNFVISSGYSYQNSNGQLLVGDYDLTLTTPPPTIFNTDRVSVKYPAHLYFGYTENQIHHRLNFEYSLYKRISLGSAVSLRNSLNRAGSEYSAGVYLKYKIVK
jgi:hypothetical protein